MLGTELYWISGPWRGRLALAARPRGGDWLEDELVGWKKMGVDAVLSLLTREEEADLGLRNEAQIVKAHGMEFLKLPIPGRQVAISESEIAAVLDNLSIRLSSGKNVVVHCRQGVGRSGLLAACLLISRGSDPNAAVTKISAARGVSVPETPEQREWIDHYAATLANSK